MSDQPIKPSDHRVGELSEEKNHLETLRVPHLVSEQGDEFARQNGNAEGRVVHQSSANPDSTLGIVKKTTSAEIGFWGNQTSEFSIVVPCCV